MGGWKLDSNVSSCPLSPNTSPRSCTYRIHQAAGRAQYPPPHSLGPQGLSSTSRASSEGPPVSAPQGPQPHRREVTERPAPLPDRAVGGLIIPRGPRPAHRSGARGTRHFLIASVQRGPFPSSDREAGANDSTEDANQTICPSVPFDHGRSEWSPR